MKYVRVYFAAGTHNIRHVACKDSPFQGDEGIVVDDVDIERADYEIDDVPGIINAAEVLLSLDVNPNGRVSINQARAERSMANVKARGYRPIMREIQGAQRARFNRLR